MSTFAKELRRGSRRITFHRRRTEDRAAAEDITSQVFVQALGAIGRFEWRGLPVSVWLFRIASNALADHWRERARTGQEAGTGGGGGGMHREVRVGDSMVIVGEGGGAGVMPLRPVAFHVLVKDADATFKRAIAAGARSLGEPADRSYGERSGFVADPFGNHWYISTPIGPESFTGAARTVTPVLHVQGAADYLGFLKQALGAVEDMRHDEGGRLRYARLRIGDAAVELGEGEPMPGSFLLYVPDPDARYEQAMASGATSLMPPADQPYGRIGGVEDARGNQWFFSRP